MELKDFNIEMLKNPIIKDEFTEDGKLIYGVRIIENHVIRFYDGKITNFILEDESPDPAVEGPGFIEYRTDGVITRDDENRPARVSNGFKHREFWKDGVLIQSEDV